MIIINNTTQQALEELTLQRIGQKFLQSYHKAGWSVSLAFIGPARMRRLNNDYRGLDRPTDVLSFPAAQADRNDKYLGEILINLAELKKIGQYQELFEEIQDFANLKTKNIFAQKRRLVGIRAKKPIKPVRIKQPVYLLYFLLVHGLLHLLGYDDESEGSRRVMLRRGWEFLGGAGYWPETGPSVK